MSKLEQAFGDVLQALAQATLTVAQPDELDGVLQQIAAAARELVGATYAAIATLDEVGQIDLFVQSGMGETAVFALPNQPQGDGLLGAVFQQQTPIRIAKISENPHFTGFPQQHPNMCSFLGVPILSDGQVIGTLYLTDKRNDSTFTRLDEQLAQMLAAHAATAIRKSLLLRSSQAQAAELAAKNRQLAALSKAAMLISGELSLEKVLQQIVEVARDLAQAEYAALGVPNELGYLDNFVYSGLSPQEAAAIGSLPHGLGLLGAIISERRTISLSNIGADKRSVGFPPGHPPMTSFLGVPIIAGQELLGNVYLTNKQGAEAFTESDAEIVELLAAHAAIAIQNAKLYEQVSRLAILDERTRIGMDLHDGVIQSIYAVGLTLESTRLALTDSNESEEAQELLQTAVFGLNDAIRDIRNFILDLRPRHFGGNLEQGLSRLVREFRANTMVNVHTSTLPDGLEGLPTAVSRAIFLTTQGALANIARHAHAENIQLTLEHQNDQILLTISDDGVGFDVQAARQAIGHGLSNMRARAKELHGTFHVHSAPGAGTKLMLSLPWR